MKEEIPPSGGNAPLAFLNSLSSGGGAVAASCGGSQLSPISLWRNKVGKKGEGGCGENECEGRSLELPHRPARHPHTQRENLGPLESLLSATQAVSQL